MTKNQRQAVSAGPRDFFAQAAIQIAAIEDLGQRVGDVLLLEEAEPQ